MGIPFYFFRICQKYKDYCIVTQKISDDKQTDVLYFDYNSLIHPCIANAISTFNDNNIDLDILQEELIDIVIQYTKDIITLINPQKKIVIAIDGVAPRAKMNQQRERRFKKIYSTEPSIFDSNMITPGTPFMKRLNQRLKEFSSDKALEIIISDSTEIGEGEHKIMKMIKESSPDLTHTIYGMDGDLIMLSLMTNDHIYLFRDDQTKNTQIYLDIQRLKRCIIKHNQDLTNLSQVETEETLLTDYIVICFLLGNDFIPGFANLSILSNGIEMLESAYKITGKSLTKNGYLNLPTFFKFLEALKSILEKNEKHLNSKFVDDIEPTEKVLLNINNSYIYSKELYNLYYGLDNNAPTEWINGLQWILSYYNRHSHQNWTWFYPYHNTPHIDDVLAMSSTINLIDFKKTDPFTSFQQLFMVLPKESLEKIDKSLVDLADSEIFKNHFPPYLILDGINKKFAWQCKPINLAEFEEDLVRLKISEKN
jgi:5'-3' exonuclease